MATATEAAAPVAATAVKKAPKQLSAPNSDFYQLADVLSAYRVPQNSFLSVSVAELTYPLRGS